MHYFIKILLGMPKWFYAALAFLLFKGIKGLWHTSTTLSKLAILPLLLISWSICSLLKLSGFSWPLMGLWTMPFLMGGAIGWYLWTRDITVDKQNKLISIPGSIYPLLLSAIFFVVKYAARLILTLKPELYSEAIIWGSDLLISSFVSGLFGGRTLHVFRKYFGCFAKNMFGKICS